MTTWVVPTGVSPDDIWEHMKNNNVIRFRCDEMGDLSNTTSYKRRKMYGEEVYKNNLDGMENDLSAFDILIEKMNYGDYVIARKGHTLLRGIGKVNNAGYYFDDTLEEYKHCRGVDWIHKGDKELPTTSTKFTRAHHIYEYDHHLDDIFELY